MAAKMNRRCIWCGGSAPAVSFDKLSHTFPKSLGGEHICDNVCDHCNHYFGSPKPNIPAVEVVLKELLNISKFILLYQSTGIPKNKRFKSEYFILNWEKKRVKFKPRYRLQKGFQLRVGRQFKRGVYKVFLEERERQIGDADSSRYDFIREFARYDLGDFPIYIIKPKFGAVFLSNPDLINPNIRFTAISKREDEEYRVYQYPIMGHNFIILTSKKFSDFSLDRFKKYLKSSHSPMGHELKEIQKASDIDFTFSFLN